MPTRRELKTLADLRLREAEALFEARCYNGTVYLAGYVVELALKARICRLLRSKEYPEIGALKGAFAVHKYDQLLFLAGLVDKLDSNQMVLENWSLLTFWGPELRYSPREFSRSEALVVLEAIREPANGVFSWIRKHW